ncbi:MAG: hypothetical protein HRU31_08310 [Rhodobacteraceae bacterium]|nr:hypothetical protein [Paracoccaceae bacterium]
MTDVVFGGSGKDQFNLRFDAFIDADTPHQIFGGDNIDMLVTAQFKDRKVEFTDDQALLLVENELLKLANTGHVMAELVSVERIIGTRNVDVFTASGSIVHLDGAGGDDVLTGSTRRDTTLIGGTGADRLEG